ncbi:efflux RND transporter periplasmic adaptor subunit [Wenyingzhuangia sp. IMCC45533]
MRKIVLSILGILLIMVAVIGSKKLIENKKKPKPVTNKVVKSVLLDTVINTNITVNISANGNLKALERIEIYSEVSGIFRKGSHLFKTGQVYQRGEVLVSVNASEHRANVQAAKSKLYNDIAAIMPDLRLDFPEVYPKWQEYLSSFNFDNSTPDLPKIENTKESYFITGRGIVSSYYNLKNLEQRLAKFSIKAPFNGILTEALVTEGSLIRNGQKLGEFINPEVYELKVSISKSLASFLTTGTSVDLVSLDHSEKYRGIISRINGSVDAATQTVSVFVEIKDKRLKEGVYLNALLQAQTIENAIEISRNLLLDTDEIFYVNQGKLNKLKVKPVYYGKETVVLKEVPNGTAILSKSVSGAYAGMLVKPYKN